MAVGARAQRLCCQRADGARRRAVDLRLALRLRDDLGHQLSLLRLFGAFSPLERLRITFGVTFYQRVFGGPDIVLGTVRHDHSVGADIVANYALDARWSLRGDLLWSNTHSNQQLFETRRSSAQLKLRYQY